MVLTPIVINTGAEENVFFQYSLSNPTIGQEIFGEVWIEFTVPGSSTNLFKEIVTLSVKYQ
ncbi:MAG: hypothetical protein ACP5M9_00470 [Candidatus Micrarchaeia archaeon]